VHNPFVPETLEGWSVLHLIYRLDWRRLGEVDPAQRDALAFEASSAVARTTPTQDDGATTLVQLLGHKGDLMVIAFRRTFDELGRFQLAMSTTTLNSFLTPTASYVSIVELGMYEMTAKTHEQLGATLKPGSEEFERAFDAEMETQRQRVISRLFLDVPRKRYVCFYPMNKRRGDVQNWYSEPFERRAAMMREHGMIGRHYAGKVTQVISGSIGFDDWEWGVDLFADDPLVFKKLIYEMRFDRASADYAEFGPFYVGLQFEVAELPALLEGRTPGFAPGSDSASSKT
jgi:hydrogen peroxide-dependent heme synthase